MTIDRSNLSQAKIDKYNSQFLNYKEDFVLTERSLLTVETTNECNSKCSFCDHKDMTRPKGFMSDDLYKKIIDEGIEIGFTRLDLRNLGEPLLDENLENKASYAKEKGFEEIYINTNGMLLTKQRFESLIKSGFSLIAFSLSPKREYEKTRPISFEKVLNNLKAISTSIYKQHLVIWLVETNDTTKEELDEFFKILKKLGLKQIIHTHQCENANPNNPNILNPQIQCKEIWENLVIGWNGDIILCHSDPNAIIDLGNAKESSLKEILNSENYKNIRKSHKDFKFIELCQKCEFPVDNITSELL